MEFDEDSKSAEFCRYRMFITKRWKFAFMAAQVTDYSTILKKIRWKCTILGLTKNMSRLKLNYSRSSATVLLKRIVWTISDTATPKYSRVDIGHSFGMELLAVRACELTWKWSCAGHVVRRAPSAWQSVEGIGGRSPI